MMNSNVMGLYFIKEINGFKKQCEANEARQQKYYCQHMSIIEWFYF